MKLEIPPDIVVVKDKYDTIEQAMLDALAVLDIQDSTLRIEPESLKKAFEIFQKCVYDASSTAADAVMGSLYGHI